jgi:Cadherin-like
MLPTLVHRIVLLLTSYRGFTTVGGSAAFTDDKSRLKYRVFEELPRGTFVANLSADISDVIASLSVDARALIRFRFLADFQPLFDIDSVSGVIRTADVIDRDVTSLCRLKETCDVNLDVVLQPVQYFQACSLIKLFSDVGIT